MNCSDILGECNESLGLSCQGETDAKSCSCASTNFFDTSISIVKCSKYIF